MTVTGEGKRFGAGGDVASLVAATERGLYLWGMATKLEAQLRRAPVARTSTHVTGLRGHRHRHLPRREPRWEREILRRSASAFAADSMRPPPQRPVERSVGARPHAG
ncbi:hypothetical protein [Rhodococcus sp. USK13]|uniref:hypothetical protein n=1 Tax=Rhodococcus sp. USK13 TaxID=2806442 RepID=UPI001BCDCECA|nr:hypothetical protein [Rhodococcus sp. USK13]